VGPYQIRSFKVLGVVQLGKSLGNHVFSHQLWGFPVKKGAIQLQIERIQTRSNSAVRHHREHFPALRMAPCDRRRVDRQPKVEGTTWLGPLGWSASSLNSYRRFHVSDKSVSLLFTPEDHLGPWQEIGLTASSVAHLQLRRQPLDASDPLVRCQKMDSVPEGDNHQSMFLGIYIAIVWMTVSDIPSFNHGPWPYLFWVPLFLTPPY